MNNRSRQTWRDSYYPIIQQGLLERLSPDQVRKEHYTLSQRKYFPDKVWLSEIKQAKQFFKTGLPIVSYLDRSFRQLAVRLRKEVEEQLALFTEELLPHELLS